MGVENLPDGNDTHIRYKYRGPGYLMGVPARDLTATDLLEVLEREGVTAAEIGASRAYEEIAPSTDMEEDR